jgi:hypothetical protein
MSKKNELIDLVPGDIDPICGGQIKYLILKEAHFIVYVDSAGDLNWSTLKYTGFPDDFGKIINKAKMLEHLVDRLFPKINRIQFKYLIGEGIARLLDDKSTINASKMLEETEISINEEGRHILKTRYIIGSISTTIAIIILFLSLWLMRDHLQIYFGVTSLVIMMASLCGGIGAFISSFFRSLNFAADVRISKYVYILDGFLRIFYGAIAGLVITLAIKSNVVLGFVFEDASISMSLLCFFSTMAGASESLVPSIIKKIEEKL